jgi:uncharacterized lipoprotein YmbA
MRRFLIMIAMASLSACGLIRPNASWVDDMPQKHAASIAEIIAMLAVERIPPGSKPLGLAPAPLTQSGDTLTASLTSALKARGYRLLTEETDGEDHHSLRYLVTAYQGRYLLRVTAGGAETSTLLKPGPDGQLIATAPLSVRETAQ